MLRIAEVGASLGWYDVTLKYFFPILIFCFQLVYSFKSSWFLVRVFRFCKKGGFTFAFLNGYHSLYKLQNILSCLLLVVVVVDC